MLRTAEDVVNQVGKREEKDILGWRFGTQMKQVARSIRLSCLLHNHCLSSLKVNT